MEANIKLEECLKRVQQENEDYKARMDKYAALSKYVCVNCVCVFSACAAYYSCLSPPAGSCPVSRPCCSSHYKRSPRSISVCPWRMKSCSGSCKIATCSRVPVASPPPPPSTHRGTRPPFRPLRPCPPDNLYLASSTF